MSLIGDALRKTRQEEAERESNRKGVLFSAKIANPTTRSNLGLGLALGAVIAVAATVAGGGAVWWLLGTRDLDQDQLQRSAATSATAASIDPDPENSDSGRDNDSGSEQQPATAPGSAIASPITVDPDPNASSDSGGGNDRATNGPSTSRPQDPASSSSNAGFTGVEDGADVYILEANLGAVQLSLDYIIFRADDPFAEINGIELHLGGVVEGYRVKAIERDRVHLSNGRKDIVLRTP
jgi:hypothetical protein